ncbi:MAG: hypothetical protein IPK19_00025 [Chloroflexi bacterium]|nr:hypothetical protein [Chloroflexota bacterium]
MAAEAANTTGIAQRRHLHECRGLAAGPERAHVRGRQPGCRLPADRVRAGRHLLGGIAPRRHCRVQKQGYGNVHPIFALAQAYGVTENPDHLTAALEQLTVFEERFLDPAYDCAIHPGFSRDFSRIIGVNNIDVFTHFFEALLALHNVTEDETRDHVDDLLVRCGDFLVNTLYQDQDGFTDRGYVAYNYDENWQPAQMPYSRDMQWSGGGMPRPGTISSWPTCSAGRSSAALTRSGWTPPTSSRFCLEYAIDAETGGMIHEITDYDGQPP